MTKYLVLRYGWMIENGEPGEVESMSRLIEEREIDELLSCLRADGFQEHGVGPDHLVKTVELGQGFQVHKGIKVYREEKPITRPSLALVRP
jgi:hypothetical protein